MWGRGISEFGAVVILAYNPKVISVLTFERFEGFGLRAAQPPAVLIVIVAFVVFLLVRVVPGAAAAPLEDGGAVIELRGLEVEAGGFRVGPVDLDGRATARYAVLLGPSGAGKSLVLEAVAGVRPAAAGEVRLAGADVTGLVARAPPRRARVPGRPAVPAPHGGDEHRLRDARAARGPAATGAGERAPRRGGRAARRGGRRARCSPAARRRSPAASASGSRWRGRSPPGPAPCCSTSRSAPSTRRRGRRCRRCCGASAASAACRCCTSRTTATRPSRSPTSAHVLIAGRVHQSGRPLDVLRRPADAAVARFLGARNVLPARRDPRDPRVARAARRAARSRVAAPLPGRRRRRGRPAGGRAPLAAPAPGTLAAQVTRLTLQGGHVLVGLEAPAPLEALVPAGELEAAGIGVGHAGHRHRAAGRRARAAGRLTCVPRPSLPDAKGFLVLTAASPSAGLLRASPTEPDAGRVQRETAVSPSVERRRRPASRRPLPSCCLPVSRGRPGTRRRGRGFSPILPSASPGPLVNPLRVGAGATRRRAATPDGSAGTAARRPSCI